MNQVNYDLLYEVYAASGLGKWFKERWVDLSRKKKGGGHPPCGASAGKGVRKKSKSKKYPKCVPASRAAGMSKKQKASAVRRKRAAGTKGKKPNWVSTKPLKEVFIATENNMKVNELLKFLNEEAKPSKKMVKENNIVETIRALVLEELAKEAATGAPASGAPAAFPKPPPTAGQPAASSATPAPDPNATAPATPPAAGSAKPAPGAPVAAAGSAPTAGQPAPVSEMKTLEEELDEAFGLGEQVTGQYGTHSTDAGVVRDHRQQGDADATGNGDNGGARTTSNRPHDGKQGSGMGGMSETHDRGAGSATVSSGGGRSPTKENLFAESKKVHGRVLSESVKNGELLMQERRRKQLIQVQNKILYSKR